MAKTYNWGIIGLGNIAHKFAHDLQLAPQANLYGVASRNGYKALEFKEKYQANVHYDSYEALAQDPNIDVVYIATPHPFHCEQTLLCLRHGKAVLCEKPFGMNQQEVVKMVKTAQEKQVFLMEALWTRW